MKKQLLLLTLIICPLMSLAQIDSTKVSFVAYWSVGDTYDFKVTKVERNLKDDVLVKNDTTIYIANFKVLDSTETRYKIQWEYKKNIKEKLGDNLLSFVEENEELKTLIEKNEISTIVYETNELGEFVGILNWEEISNLTLELLNKVEEVAIKKSPENTEVLKRVLAPFKEMYTSKTGVEQLIMVELQFFHFPLGSEYDITTPIEYEQELPDMVGTGPITGNVTLSIEDVDFEDYYCVLVEEVSINEKESKQAVKAMLERMIPNDEEVQSVLKDSKLDITDYNYYQYYYYPGVPHRIYGSRNTLLNMENSKFEKFTELIIELIYED